MSRWAEETLYDDCKFCLKLEKLLYERSSEHQSLLVAENLSFGRVLYLDGVLQTTEADEFIYHEMMAHVPILAHGRAESALIVGGGDGGMLREVLKHRSIDRVVQVEIDPEVIAFCREHLPNHSQGRFDDPRLELVIADGKDYLDDCGERFDIVIIDSTDPIGPGEALFTPEFYRACKTALGEDGILVTQNGVPFLQPEELRNTMRAFRDLFRDASCYLAAVPTYIGGAMAFGWGSDRPEPRQTSLEVLKARYRDADLELRYLNPEVHQASFALPTFVRELVEG